MKEEKPLKSFLSHRHDDDDIVIVGEWRDNEGIDISTAHGVTAGSFSGPGCPGWTKIDPPADGSAMLEAGFAPFFPGSVPEENMSPENFIWIYCEDDMLVAAIIKLDREPSMRVFSEISVNLVM